MIIVMLTALNATVYTLQAQERVTQSVIEKTDEKLSDLNEKISIPDVRITGTKFNMTIANDGGIVANVKSIYIVDETAVPKEQHRYDVDYFIDGRSSITNVGQLLPLDSKPDAAYTIKIVSAAGNTAISRISPVSASAYPLSLSVIPPTITPRENVTVLFTVTNNHTATNLAAPVGVKIKPSITGCTLGTPGCKMELRKPPSNNNTLIAKGSTAVFQWSYYIEAPDNSKFSFNATLVNARQGNYVIEGGEVQLIEESQTAGSADTVVVSTLIQKPEIFLMFPSPFGDSVQKGIWGVAVANPTDQPMQVTKIVVSAISPRPQANDRIIDTSGGDACAAVNISPPGPNYWSCPAMNMVMWKNVNPGFTIPGRSDASFMVEIKPGSLSAGWIDLESYTIQVTVFTSMGQFAKSGYSGSMRNSAGALPQVYLSKFPDSINPSDMIGNYTSLKNGTRYTFNAVIAELDSGPSNYINAGSRLIVDLPKCFSDVVVTGSSPDLTVSPPQLFGDKSWQIIGTLTAALTGNGQYTARTITFEATVAYDTPDKRLYVIYVLADGESDGATAFAMGPIAEVPVQVIP